MIAWAGVVDNKVKMVKRRVERANNLRFMICPKCLVMLR